MVLLAAERRSYSLKNGTYEKKIKDDIVRIVVLEWRSEARWWWGAATIHRRRREVARRLGFVWGRENVLM